MRRNSQKWIPFGFDTVSNKIVDIASVENGLSCNCVCLICGTSLIAKQGKNQKWHFLVIQRSKAMIPINDSGLPDEVVESAGEVS